MDKEDNVVADFSRRSFSKVNNKIKVDYHEEVELSEQKRKTMGPNLNENEIMLEEGESTEHANENMITSNLQH